MKEKLLQDERNEKVLVGVISFSGDRDAWGVDEIENEMKELVEACGGEVVESMILRVKKFTPDCLISKTKAKEIADICALKKVDTVILSHELKGSQKRNLEEIIRVKTIDRTQLILDIFARHATSKEGKTQVELAQLEYLLPRLVGKGSELSRLGGGIGTLGPGETKLEMDRRRISEKIIRLKHDLEETAKDRALKRKKRKDKGVPSISLVGYTNAGKSTLLNALTQADQITRDGLFTTLDSLSRQLILPNHQKMIISDTVGFMHELPHHLIEAFKATLEEVKEADLLLHVLDVSHAQFRHLQESVEDVLKELEAYDKPIILVLNKKDKVEDACWLKDIEKSFKNAVCVSAKTKEGLDQLFERISQMLVSLMTEVNVDVPINRMDLVSLAHKEGEVISIKYYETTINIRVIVPKHVVGHFYIKEEESRDKEGWEK